MMGFLFGYVKILSYLCICLTIKLYYMDVQKEIKKDILNSERGMKLLRNFNLKRIVAGRGHDCGGLIADLCIKSKVMAEYHDDGWGGEPEIRFLSDDKENSVKTILTDGNWATILFEDCGYAFMDSPDKIDFQTQVSTLVESLYRVKEHDKIMKKCDGSFIIGDEYSYYGVEWKGKKLSEIPTPVLQKTYDTYKGKLKDGQYFYNTDKQLKELGIKI